MTNPAPLPSLLRQYQSKVLSEWVREQLATSTWRGDLMTEEDLRRESTEFLQLLSEAWQSESDLMSRAEQQLRLREMLASISRLRASKGFSFTETATFIFSLKQPLFTLITEHFRNDPDAVRDEIWHATTLLDQLGLYTAEVYQKTREDMIRRQQDELLELSTPVVKLWDGILALPLIGTLDSSRTQVVMENLLRKIVETESTVVIIDITGVPTVDTLIAQHLLRTVAASRLMGSECIISGIRPQIAQTIVHLGVDLRDVTTKATLADAFALALQRVGLRVARAREYTNSSASPNIPTDPRAG